MLKELFRYFMPHSKKLGWVLMAAIVAAIGEAVAMISIVPLAEMVSSDNQQSSSIGPIALNATRNQLTALAAIAIVLSAGAHAVAALVRARITTAWEAEQRVELYRRFLDSNWPTQASERGGHLQQTAGFVGNGASALGQLGLALMALFSLAVLFGVAAVVDWRAAGLIIALGVGLFMLLRPVSHRAKALSRAHGKSMVSVGVEMEEGIRQAREIRLFDARERFLTEMDDRVQQSRRVRWRSLALTGFVTPLYRSLGLLLVVSILAIVTRLDTIDPTTFGAVALILLRSLSYGQQFQNVYTAIVDQRGRLDLLDQAMDTYLSAEEGVGSVLLTGSVRCQLEGITYRYDDSPATAVDDLSLVIERGEKLGVMGPSGGGKSTLAQLLVRLRPPSEGRFIVNGLDASSYTPASWSERVALVPQDVRLTHATVAENIGYYRPWITKADVERAARQAGIHETILALPSGYDTNVGPADRALSGGQIQRLGIARALAGQPSLLVLDEPTSALDGSSEEIIHDTVSRLESDVTVVIIAHRLSTLEACDRVIEIEAGQLLREGSPEEILPKITLR